MDAITPLYVDTAVGSNQLEPDLLAMGLPVEMRSMEFGDVVFTGRGEGGAPLYIGIELKMISELVGSLTTKRFQGHQLLGLCRDFDRRYLLIEGDYHHDERGRVLGATMRPMKGAPSALALEQEVLNMQTRGGLWVRHTTGRRDTLRFIHAAYRYWTDKDLDQHKSHLALYAPDLDKGLLTPPTDFRKALAAILPGVSYTVSKAVEDHVGGRSTSLQERLRRLLAMSYSDWANLAIVDGKGKSRRFGETRAAAILRTLQKGG